MSELAIVIGASKGLGRDVADECLRNGMSTIEMSRSVCDCREGSRTLVRGDFSSEDSTIFSLGRMFSVCRSQISDVTKVFFVAGKFLKGDFEYADGDEIREVMGLNLLAPIHTSHVLMNCLPAFLDDRDLQLIYVASTTGLRARSDEAAYAASKFGLVGFVRSLGKEMERRKKNTKIMLVTPGGMKTSFGDKYPDFDTTDFLDTNKVAQKIVDEALLQDAPYKELLIERGSL